MSHFFVLTVALLVSGDGSQVISYADLLESMIDLRWLATDPPEGERCFQFSSYDRGSEAGRENPDAWYANGDCGKYLREEVYGGRPHYVMADCEGPGAIVRIWSANPAGELLFFVDGGLALSIPFQDLCSGTIAPFEAPLCGVHARGWNCYVPIPFQEHLKILATNNGFYYHVNIRRFPPGTRVPSYSRSLLEESSDSLSRARGVLGSPLDLYPAARTAPRPIETSVAPKGTSALLRLEGAGWLRRLALQPKAADLRAGLRATRLLITADGARRPQVDCPLGDFFGTAPDLTPYPGYPMGVTNGGMGYCHFPMPFAKGLEVTLVNEGSAALDVEGEYVFESADVAHYPLRFHAGWRAQLDLPTLPRSDFLVLDTRGRGRFVGCSLMLRNPVRNWWGEGDEHFFVDGETFPSTFGTGTEDYFGYAWGCSEVFHHAYHNQPRCDGPDTYGYTSVNRFHIVDQVAFAKSFRFDLEVWHWVDCKIDMATAAYWYGSPDSMHTFTAMPAAARIPRPVEPLVIKRVAGAIEGEKLRVVSKTGGEARSHKHDIRRPRPVPGAS
ncbi:MAG: glycoside hydrolase family 172 protein [Planctomycetota bacterium]